MCAVVVIVIAAGFARPLERSSAAAVNTAGDIQVEVLEVDPGIDYCHIHIDPVVIGGIDADAVV